MVVATLLSIVLLETTEQFGYVVASLKDMVGELIRFFTTFGMIFVLFILVLRFLHQFILSRGK